MLENGKNGATRRMGEGEKNREATQCRGNCRLSSKEHGKCSVWEVKCNKSIIKSPPSWTDGALDRERYQDKRVTSFL